ncbi:MAG: c-type cytochrome [Gammaproteobacteria bacterium]|nr:c-type cytochrome [Gammaproteobacteria bacterium]
MRKNMWLTICLIAVCEFITSAGAYAQINKDLLEKYKVPSIKEPLLNKSNNYRLKLGKTLFFDPRLSGSNWISCATCHNPALGWSDGLPTAIGEGQKKLHRATPTILNTAFNVMQMWDGRFRSLEDQAMSPVESNAEMNQDPEELVKELEAIPGYVELFNDAYPGRGITTDTIAMALASFQRSIVAGIAPFDRWIAGEDKAISAAAKRGFALFEGNANCSTCHSGFNFTDDGFHNIGLNSNDIGRFAVKPVAVTKGAFKTPTLRNVTRTAPYMHNGAYNTLEEVVEHYARGGDDKSNLSPNFKPAKLNYAEKQDLLEFLKTLESAPAELTYPEMPN